jgi:hypothetical protein
MNRKYVIIMICLLSLSSGITTGDVEIRELPLEPTEPKQVPILTGEMSFVDYTYTAFEKYYSSDIDFRDDYESDKGGMHTISMGERNKDGSGQIISFGFTDTIRLSGKGTTFLGGYGDIEVKMKRYDFAMSVFEANTKYNNHIGIKYTHIEREYDYQKISGTLNSQTFDVDSDYFGLFYGFGANDPIFKETPWISYFWSVQLLAMIGSMDEMEVGYDGDIHAVQDYYTGDKERTTSFAGGLNGTAGIQFHLGENSSIGIGYKGQYLKGGDMEDSYHGWMAMAVLRF